MGLSSSPQMVTRNCSLRAPLMRLPSRKNSVEKLNHVISSTFLSHIYLRHFFFLNENNENIRHFLFFCPSSSVIFSLEIYLFMIKEKKSRLPSSSAEVSQLRFTKPINQS